MVRLTNFRPRCKVNVYMIQKAAHCHSNKHAIFQPDKFGKKQWRVSVIEPTSNTACWLRHFIQTDKGFW